MRMDDPSRSSENETSDSAAILGANAIPPRGWCDIDDIDDGDDIDDDDDDDDVARNADAGFADAARETAAAERRRRARPIVIFYYDPSMVSFMLGVDLNAVLSNAVLSSRWSKNKMPSISTSAPCRRR